MNKLLDKFNHLKEKITKYFDIILLIYMILNVVYINVGSYFLIRYIWTNLQFTYGYMIFLVINIFLIKYLVISKKYKKIKIDFILKLIAIFAIIATVFAYDVREALFGHIGRCEGLLVILYYLTLVFLASFVKKEYRKILIYSILMGGFVQSIYSIFQKFHLFGVYKMLHQGGTWVYGFATHPNFFGSLMTICIGYSIGLFIDSKKLFQKILFIALTCCYFMGMLLSCTLSAIVGLIAIMIILLIYAIKNKYVKKYILICIILGYILSTAHFFNLTSIVRDLVKTKNETTNIAKGDLNDNYGTGRLYVWKQSIKIAPKYILHGVGVDNFDKVLNGTAIANKSGYFDKAHNEYLQILITMGIFSLISYLCLYFTTLKNGIKNTFKNKEICLVLPIIGYIVQAQFNISVIEVAPFFYISLGLLVDR